jgi:hypothetical protein
MPQHQVSASANIQGPASRVYHTLADYRHGHPRIIPRPPFVFLEVEEGGFGAGTVIRFSMRVMGRTQIFRAEITEPEPGRVLVETDLSGAAVTTFTVDRLPGGERTGVQIVTELETRSGLLGKLQRAIMTRILRPTYERELKNLEEVVQADLKRDTESANRSTPESAGPHSA